MPGNNRSGNRSAQRGKPLQKRVVIDENLAHLLRTYAPDVQIQQLVNVLLSEFLIKQGYPYQDQGDKS